MIPGLDSAQPPTAAQVAAAKVAGIAVWSGYLATRPNVGLFRPWSQAEFAVVKTLPGQPIAFCSGNDDPGRCRALAEAWGVRICLDVEPGIRGDGPWVQDWLDAAACGLYGTVGVHFGRRAAFHIGAWYINHDPATTWPASWSQPAAPCGWQWQNTHTEFSVPVDRSWLDDSFAQGGHMFDANDRATLIKLTVASAAAGLGIVLTDAELDVERVKIHDNLDNLQSVLAEIKAAHPTPAVGGPTSGTITGTIKLS